MCHEHIRFHAVNIHIFLGIILSSLKVFEPIPKCLIIYFSILIAGFRRTCVLAVDRFRKSHFLNLEGVNSPPKMFMTTYFKTNIPLIMYDFISLQPHIFIYIVNRKLLQHICEHNFWTNYKL